MFLKIAKHVYFRPFEISGAPPSPRYATNTEDEDFNRIRTGGRMLGRYPSDETLPPIANINVNNLNQKVRGDVLHQDTSTNRMHFNSSHLRLGM